MLAVLALATIASLAQGEGGPAWEASRLHLGGDVAADRAALEQADLALVGLAPTLRGRSGPGYRLGARDDEPGRAARLGPLQLGPTGCLELWVRAEGLDLEGRFDVGGFRLEGRLGERTARLDLGPGGDGPERAADGTRRVRLAADTWHHLALAWDLGTTGTVRLVVDGEPQVLRVGRRPEDARGGAVPLRTVADLALRLTGGGPAAAIEVDELRVHDRFVTTAELAARAGDGRTGPAALTDRGLRTPGAWAAGAFERVVPSGAGADWVAGHWERDDAPGGPHARTCHATVSVGDGRVLVFGGELRDTHAGRMANGDDTWLYDLDARTWERIAGGHTGRGGAGPARDPGLAPGPRCHQGVAVDRSTGQVFLMSGWFNAPDGGHVYRDVWLLDLAARSWRALPQVGSTPAISDVEPVFHVGLGRFLFLSTRDAWAMDPAGGELERLPNPVVVDERRAPLGGGTTGQAMTWYDPDTDLVLRFGGFRGRGVVDGDARTERTAEVFVYGHDLGVWVLRDPVTPAPSPRVRGAVAYDTRRDRSVLFGGITGGLDERASDLWAYATLENRWTSLRASNPPGPRGGYFGMAYDEERDVFVVPFGRQDRDVFLDEVWRLSFDDEAWGSATWRFDRAGWPDGLVPAVAWGEPVPGTEEADGSTVEELEPRLLLRGSEDGVTFGAWGEAVGDERFVDVRVELPPGMRLTGLGWE